MTLLVVLGVVVIATILAALYLSLKSGRGDAPDLDDAGAGERQARGESRSGRSASLAGRVRSMADRGKAAGSSRRRFGGDDNDEYDVPDYVAARRSSRGAVGGDRSSLVTAGTGQRASGGREAGGFDRTDPAVRAGYGHAAGYDGYDAAADTHVSGPMGADPGTGPYATGGYDASGYDPGTGPMPGYGSEPPRGYRDRDRAGGRGRDADSPRGRYPGAGEGAGDDGYPSADRSSSAYPPEYSPGGRRGAGPGERAAGPGGYGAPTGAMDALGPDGPATGGFGAPAAGDFGGAAGDFGGAARSPRGHGRPAGRRRAPEPDPSPGYDDARTALTDSPFSSAAGPDSPSEDADDTGGGSRSGRRRVARIQKPQLRLGRSRQDYDNDPWPEADEIDGVSDDQFWSDLSSDKPLATTARTAQAPGDAGQPWTPGDGSGRPGGPGAAAGPDSPGMVSAPVEADTQAMGRGRRARRRAAEPEDGTEPRPRQQPDRGPAAFGGPGGPGGPAAPGGARRRGEPAQSARGAEEDPLTSASFSRHAREASDSRSYRTSRQTHRPSHGRPDASTDETQTFRPDPRGYGAPGPGGPNAPTGPNAVGGPAGRRDPYGDSGYRTGARPAGSYPESTGGYQSPARGSRHASPPAGARPPAAGNPGRSRPALPGPAPGTPSYPDPAYPDQSSPRTGGSPAYPGGNGTSAYPGPNGSSSYPGSNGNGPYPGTYGEPAPPGGSGGTGGYRGRRSSNRDPRRPDDPYEDPYGRPDDTRY